MIWQRLMETYDNNINRCVDIAPIAHTKIKGNIGILIDSFGIFRMAAEIDNETVIVPCTIESETRTSAVAPHLIHDNLSYVGNIDGFEKRHEAYMKQLRDYALNGNAPYAKAIYNYLERGTIMQDIAYILSEKKNIEKINIVFSVYRTKDDTTIDSNWTSYYTAKLPKNGICMMTGEPDHIPKAYPAGIRYGKDFGRLLVANPMKLDEDRCVLRAGYIASQKCLHVLQALMEEDKSYVLEKNKELKNLVYAEIPQ